MAKIRKLKNLVKEVLKGLCIFLGLTSSLYCMWIVTTDPVPKFCIPIAPVNSITKHPNLSMLEEDTTLTINRENVINETFVILDYTGNINNVKADYFIGNCLVTKNHGLIEQADAVAITTRRLRSKQALPKFRGRWQRWVWVLDENPHHAIDGQPFSIADFKNVYNWTMTYRTSSDVYIPYGRTKLKSRPDKTIPDLGKREKLAAAVISNCNSHYVHNSRMEYIKTLEKTVPVTIYGKCGTICPGFTKKQFDFVCPELSNYLFYLAFENSNCKEYITEKFFGNGFESGAVPVVLGAPKEDYTKIAPPNSFIHVRDFASPQKLGEYLQYLANNRTAYMLLHEWRKEYTTSSRIQSVTRSVWEPLCAKLNEKPSVENVISNLHEFWTVSDCDDKAFW